MKVAIITTSINSDGGGVSEVALQHYANLKNNFNVKLFASGSDLGINDNKICISPRFLGGKFAYFPGMSAKLKAFQPDIVHQHGIWNYLSIQGNKIRPDTKLVVSPHGMLDDWILNNKRIQKTILNIIGQKRNIFGSSMIHALTDKEAEDVRRYGYKGPIAIIPNGIDYVKDSPHIRELPNEGLPTRFLYLGRIDKKKRVMELCLAFSELLKSGLNLTLDIFGWGDPDYIRDIENVIHNNKGINFHGPAFGSVKEDAFRDSNFLVLPSLSEGLPMVVLEAWSFGLPTILTENCNLPDGFEYNASLKTGSHVKDIVESINSALNLNDDEYRRMCLSTLKLVRESYNHSRVSDALALSYNWLENNVEKPSFIHLY